jgi:hypothetical protein
MPFNAVGIATSYGLEGLGIEVQIPVAVKYFPVISSRPVLGSTQPLIQWVSGTLAPET